MKRLVIKTTLITLASIIGALIIAVGALCLFAPKTMANFFEDVGNYSASVFFYEKNYEKTGSISDLDELLLKVYVESDYELTEKYSKEMIEHVQFESLSVANKEYYYGCYVIALANNGKFDQAINVGKDFVQDYGYTVFNPLRILITDYLQDDMTENKQSLRQAVLSTTNVSAEQEVYKTQDLIQLG